MNLDESRSRSYRAWLVSASLVLVGFFMLMWAGILKLDSLEDGVSFLACDLRGQERLELCIGRPGAYILARANNGTPVWEVDMEWFPF